MTIPGLHEKQSTRLLKSGKNPERHQTHSSKEGLAKPDEINSLVEEFRSAASEVLDAANEILDKRRRH